MEDQVIHTENSNEKKLFLSSDDRETVKLTIAVDTFVFK